MESILKGLFDFQRFAQNDELQKLIDEVSDVYESRALSTDELETVSAAGDAFTTECPFSTGDPFAVKDGSDSDSEDDV